MVTVTQTSVLPDILTVTSIVSLDNSIVQESPIFWKTFWPTVNRVLRSLNLVESVCRVWRSIAL